MDNNIFLRGEKCMLQPLEFDDAGNVVSLISQWMNDDVVTHFMFTGQKPLEKEQITAMMKKDMDEGNVVFIISDIKSRKLLGYGGLYSINPVARKAEFRILIGDKNFWGKGYGTEITELITYYGFDRLNLHRIYLGYTVENKGAGKAYEKAGYKHEGVLKEDIYRNSRYYDTVRMAILRKDYYGTFYESHKKRFSILPEL